MKNNNGYTGGQWCDTGLGGTWQRLASGLTPSFLGNGSYHDLKNSWSYWYCSNADEGTWVHGNLTVFCYSYTYGQWWDKYSTSWHKLGVCGISPAFIGDGAYHQAWSDGAKYKYIASTDLGYWSSTGVTNDDDFRINYGTSQWYRYYDGSTVYDAVEYKGNRQYLLSDYIYWTSAGLNSTTPTGSSYGTDVQNILWLDSTNKALATWYIFTPGTDLKWSGGALNVYITNTHDQGYYKVRHLAYDQYTNEDVLTLQYDLEGGVTLSHILDDLGYLTATYGQTIDNLAVRCHGSTTSFWWGDRITTSNYNTTYSTQWTRLNNLMTNGGQLQLWHCLVGANTDGMLDSIASRANVRIFANINSQWNDYIGSGKLIASREFGDSDVWNNNYFQWFIGMESPRGSDLTQPKDPFIDQELEYQSDHSGNRGYTSLLTLYNPGLPQADMVYWWNNGNGRP